MSKMTTIHHFHIDHKALCSPPPPLPPPKNICITIVSNFSWGSVQSSQEKSRTMGEQNLGGGGGVNKVHYGLRENGESPQWPEWIQGRIRRPQWQTVRTFLSTDFFTLHFSNFSSPRFLTPDSPFNCKTIKFHKSFCCSRFSEYQTTFHMQKGLFNLITHLLLLRFLTQQIKHRACRIKKLKN